MTEVLYYKPCSTCHNADCVWMGTQDTHEKCEDYQSLEQEPKTGHWVFKQFDEETGISDNYWCSECGKPLAQVYKTYCANCGAKMSEVSNE